MIFAANNRKIQSQRPPFNKTKWPGTDITSTHGIINIHITQLDLLVFGCAIIVGIQQIYNNIFFVKHPMQSNKTLAASYSYHSPHFKIIFQHRCIAKILYYFLINYLRMKMYFFFDG